MMLKTLSTFSAQVGVGAALGALCVCALASSVQAQQQPQQPPVARPPASAPAKAPVKAPAPGTKSPDAAAPGNAESSLRQRVEQLEEQLVDMQVVVGTLESLGRSGGGSGPGPRGPASSGFGGPEAGRVAALETQLQALTAQVEQMSDQIRIMRGGATALPPAAAGNSYRSMTAAPAGAGGFGAATVAPGAADPIGQLINAEPRAPAAGVGPGMTSAGSRQLYEQSYKELLQQNYPAAEAGFAEFLQRFPGDELAANAQFWLGETFFVRGQWDGAAEAFLKVVKSYGNSVKAPDSLAKLAMAFERKGNKQAACRALSELNTRYPNPPPHVKTWEVAERRKAGCV